MSKTAFRLTLTGVAAILSASWALAPALAQTQAQTTVVDARRLFDGERVIDAARLVIEDGRVVAVGPAAEVEAPAGAETVDLGDRVVIPGLIAGHSHVGMVRDAGQEGEVYTRGTVTRDLAQFQRYGVTVVNALGMNGPAFHELRHEFRGGGHGGADLYGAGPGARVDVSAGDVPPQGGQPARIATPEGARAAVERMAADGVDMIKLWVDGPNARAPEVYGAAIETAHAHGLRVAAHIHDLEDARGVVEAGVDIVAHGVRDQPVDDALITAMRERGVWYVPTVNINEGDYLYAENPQWLEDPFFRMALSPAVEAQLADPQWRREAIAGADRARRAVAMNLENLRRVHAGGVRVALGTDSGAFPLRLAGFAEHLELAHLVDAGMTPVEALTAATSGAAEMMGLEDRGRLTPGARADFVVLGGDPTVDIAASRTLEAVWRDGAPATR